jgi:hypothetical protein
MGNSPSSRAPRAKEDEQMKALYKGYMLAMDHVYNGDGREGQHGGKARRPGQLRGYADIERRLGLGLGLGLGHVHPGIGHSDIGPAGHGMHPLLGPQGGWHMGARGLHGRGHGRGRRLHAAPGFGLGLPGNAFGVPGIPGIQGGHGPFYAQAAFGAAGPQGGMHSESAVVVAKLGAKVQAYAHALKKCQVELKEAKAHHKVTPKSVKANASAKAH